MKSNLNFRTESSVRLFLFKSDMDRSLKVCQLLVFFYLFISDYTVSQQPPDDIADLDTKIKEIFDIPSGPPYGSSDQPPIETDYGTSAGTTPPDTQQPTQPYPTTSQPEQPVTPQPHPPYEQSPNNPQHVTSNINPSENEANPCLVGECVPYYLCANGSIITSGQGILDVRFGGEDNPDPEFHPCKGLFQTCCSLKTDEIDWMKIPKIERKEGCGFRNYEGVGFRITGERDNEAQYAEFPWMVAIIKVEPSLQDVLNVYQCGGSLIHPKVVLTAAHCVYGKRLDTLKIRAGEWDTQTRDELFPHQDQQVSEIIIHENYYKGGLFNDVALLLLQEPVELSEIINTACLPPQNHNFDGSRCYASGWGKDVWGKEGKYQVILKKVDLPIIPRQPCLERLRSTRLGHHFNLHSSFICAGGEPGKDTCKGDGGSPMVCPIPGEHERYFQTGIVSWGIGCAGSTPGVYVNVAQFREWIDQQFQYKQLDPSSYSI